MKSTVAIVPIAWLIGACGVAEEVYQRDVNALKSRLQVKEKAFDDLTKRCRDISTAKDALVARARAEHEALTGKLVQCTRELEVLQSRGGKLSSKLRTALERIERLENLAKKQRAVFQRLENALASLVKAGKLQVAIVRGQFTLQLRDKILFDTGQSYLKKDGKETIAEVARALAALPGRRYQVAGHTDSIGGEAGNWKLSAERAWSVTKTLIKGGVSSEALSFAGYGQFQPTASNDDDETRAQNRRIEIVLIPDMEELMAPILSKPAG